VSVPIRATITTKTGRTFGVNEDYDRVRSMINQATPLATPGFLEFSDGDGERVMIRRDDIASVEEGRY
jgi:hypothetical protein